MILTGFIFFCLLTSEILADPLPVNVIVVGKNQPDKNNLLRRFSERNGGDRQDSGFEEMDIIEKHCHVDGKKFNLRVWNTLAETELTGFELVRANAAVMVLDYNHSDPVENTARWANIIRSYAPENIPVYLAMNEEAELMAGYQEDLDELLETYGVQFRYISLSTGEGVQELFRATLLSVAHDSSAVKRIERSQRDSICPRQLSNSSRGKKKPACCSLNTPKQLSE